MTYKSLMVHFDLSPGAFTRLKLARSLAGRLEARLIGFCAAETGEPLTVSAALPSPLLDERREDFKRCFQGLEHTFNRQVAGLPIEWRSDLCPPVDFAAINGRAADVIIVGRTLEADAEPGFYLSPGPLIMTAGRPVLVVPPGVDALSADRIVVAWKDGRHARSAIQQALPMLVGASEVIVVGVGEEVDEQQLEDVCSYLRLHQAPAAPRWHGLGRQTAAEVIIAEARRAGADLIVAGGYGRGRLLEWALGGVTEDLLAMSPVCCLLAH